MYRIPAEFVSEEKIFGGKYTLRHFVFSVSGGILAVLVFTLPIWVGIRVISSIIFLVSGIALAFYRVGNIDLLTFILRYIQFSLRPRDIILLRADKL